MHHPDPDPRTLTVLCRVCGLLLEPFGVDYWRHARPRCGVWMPLVKEHCARYAGHAATRRHANHRRRTVMDDDNAGRRAA